MGDWGDARRIYGKRVKSDDTPANNEVVTFDSGTDQYVNAAGGSGAVALTDLTDVTITAPAAAEYLRKGAGDWVNAVILQADLPSTSVSASSTHTLTNKTIDADGTGNSITNIENADIKAAAAIDATKIADGSVTSTEFQYISTVTSNVQTQLNRFLSVVKTSDETITADTNLNDDSELTLTLAINKNYVGWLFLLATSPATADFKLAFTLPAGASGEKPNAGGSDVAFTASSSITAGLTGLATSGSIQYLKMPIFVHMGGTAGNITFQWAQNTSDAGNTTVHAGSAIILFTA